MCRLTDWLVPFRSVPQMNKERLMKMAGAVRTGGKGTMRRYVLLTSSALACLVFICGCEASG
jgi:hypothetical protein